MGISCKLIIGDGLYGYVCRLSIHHYGGGLRPPPQQWGGCLRRPPHCCGLHNGGWKGGKHSHTTYPQRFTYNIHPHQVLVVGRFFVFVQKTTSVIFERTNHQKSIFMRIFHQKSTYIGPSLPKGTSSCHGCGVAGWWPLKALSQNLSYT